VSVVTLIELSPRRAADGAVVVIRLSHNAPSSSAMLGEDWADAVLALPDFEIDLGFRDGNFGQGTTLEVGRLVVQAEALGDWPALVWAGAAVRIRSAPWPRGDGNPADGDFGAAAHHVVDRMAVSASGELALKCACCIGCDDAAPTFAN